MNFEDGPSQSFCSRAGQKRPHSHISSTGRNSPSTSLERTSTSNSSAWHRSPFATSGRYSDLEGTHRALSGWITEERGEPADSNRELHPRDRSQETHGEDTDRFMRLQLPRPTRHERFAGDGFDFRRPIFSNGRSQSRNSSNMDNAIDLTGSDDETESGPSQSDTTTSMSLQVPTGGRPRSALADFLMRRRFSPPAQPARRPPRFGANLLQDDVEVIDLASSDEDTSQRPRRAVQNHDLQRASPEVEFLSSRPRVPTRPTSITPGSAEFTPGAGPWSVDLVYDDLQIVRENLAQPRQLGQDQPPYRVGGFPQEVARQLRTALSDAAGQRVGRQLAEQVIGPQGFLLPGQLNFTLPAFQYGVEEPEPEPEAVSYDPPSAAPQGFTRSPHENDVLLCPNCDRELCSGDTDLEIQVWVLKPCGHVYCGTCAANRSSSATKRRERNVPTKSAAFKHCKVEGCGKKCSGSKSMFQLFL